MLYKKIISLIIGFMFFCIQAMHEQSKFLKKYYKQMEDYQIWIEDLMLNEIYSIETKKTEREDEHVTNILAQKKKVSLDSIQQSITEHKKNIALLKSNIQKLKENIHDMKKKLGYPIFYRATSPKLVVCSREDDSSSDEKEVEMGLSLFD